jgi:hypothetical protein
MEDALIQLATALRRKASGCLIYADIEGCARRLCEDMAALGYSVEYQSDDSAFSAHSALNDLCPSPGEAPPSPARGEGGEGSP